MDFLSHAAIVGFMNGAAIIVCLQQLKGILGLVHFTLETDIVSVLRAVFTQTHQVPFHYNFHIFLVYFKLKLGQVSIFLFPMLMVAMVLGCCSGDGKVVSWAVFFYHSSSSQNTM